jgi:hypothetical protein
MNLEAVNTYVHVQEGGRRSRAKRLTVRSRTECRRGRTTDRTCAGCTGSGCTAGACAASVCTVGAGDTGHNTASPSRQGGVAVAGGDAARRRGE